jgi:peptide/nickel transport system substrate-binding protein
VPSHFRNAKAKGLIREGSIYRTGIVDDQMIPATRRNMKRLLALLVLLAFGVTLAQTDNETYVIQAFGDVDTLDPAQAYDSASGQILENVYETLYAYKGESVTEYEPALAESYEASADGLTYTYTLRQGVKFHSGNDFACKDVEYSIQRALATNPGDSGSWILMEPLTGYYSDVATELGEGATDEQFAEAWTKIDNSVVCVDDYTVQFNLVAPDPSFFAKLLFYGFAVVDSAWAIENGVWDGTGATLKEVSGQDLREGFLHNNMSGTGAYQLVSREAGQQTVTEAFDGYWGGAPTIKNVLIKVVEDQAANILALQQGDADEITLGERSALSQLEGDPNITIYNKDGELGWQPVATSAISMVQGITAENNPNIGSGQLDGAGIPPDFFSDLDLRRCMAYSFDPQAYIDQVLLGAGSQITMALPPSYLGYDPNIPTYEYDPEQAESACRSAWDGQVWENGFEFTISYNSGNIQRQTIGEIIKANLEALNPKFRVNVQGLEWPDYLDQRNQTLLPVSTAAWIPDYADPDNYITTYYASDGYYAATTGFSDPEIDKLNTEARTSLDPETRKLLYSQIGSRAYEQIPYILVPQGTPYLTIRSSVQGVTYNPMYSGNFLWKTVSKQ